MKPQVTLIIPAYNEAKRGLQERLEYIVRYLRSLYEFELLVVDDGSSDNTAEIVQAISLRDNRVRLIQQPCNKGKGAAIRRGLLEAQGRIVAFSDADLSTPIEELPSFVEALQNGYDLAIGVRPSKRDGQPLHRLILGFFLSRLVRWIVLPGIKDSQCGFKALRGGAAKAIAERMTIDCFTFDVEMLYIARKLGYRTSQISVDWSDDGESSVKFSDGIKFILQVFQIRMRRVSREQKDVKPEPVSRSS